MILLTGEEWRELLKDYESNENYKFLPFGYQYEKDIWNDLIEPYHTVEIKDFLDEFVVYLIDKIVCCIHSFKKNDDSFGSFLRDNIYFFTLTTPEYEEKDDNTMAILSNNAYGTVAKTTAYNDATIATYNDYNNWGINTGIETITYSRSDEISNLKESIKAIECELNTKMDKAELKVEKKKENKTMFKSIGLDFGPCKNEKIGLSMYGLSVLNNEGKWVSYNQDSEELIAVEVFNLSDGGKFMYKVPVPFKKIKVGDILIHNGTPVFVKKVNKENETFDVLDPKEGELKTIILTKNIFGFNFATKIVSMMEMASNTPTADKPFGNMLPFLMMGEGKSDDALTMMMLLNQGEEMDFMKNPMMLMMLKDKKDIDPMMLMMMMNMNK